MQLQGKLNPTESALGTRTAQNSEEQADNLKPSNNILHQGRLADFLSFYHLCTYKVSVDVFYCSVTTEEDHRSVVETFGEKRQVLC